MKTPAEVERVAEGVELFPDWNDSIDSDGENYFHEFLDAAWQAGLSPDQFVRRVERRFHGGRTQRTEALVEDPDQVDKAFDLLERLAAARKNPVGKGTDQGTTRP